MNKDSYQHEQIKTRVTPWNIRLCVFVFIEHAGNRDQVFPWFKEISFSLSNICQGASLSSHLLSAFLGGLRKSMRNAGDSSKGPVCHSILPAQGVF